MKWKKVDKHGPPVNLPVLVVIEGREKAKRVSVCECTYDGIWLEFDGDYKPIIDEVATHWMPLPNLDCEDVEVCDGGSDD